MDLDAEAFEMRGDDARGPHLLEADLGMGVEIAPEGGQFVRVAADAVDRAHSRAHAPASSPSGPPRRNGDICAYSSMASRTARRSRSR